MDDKDLRKKKGVGKRSVQEKLIFLSIRNVPNSYAEQGSSDMLDETTSKP